MAPRLELQELLLTLAPYVYFQPPSSLLMQYPCIRYELNAINTRHADNAPYSHKKRYQVTIMDRSPDSDIPDGVGALPMASFDRFYTADDLNHYVYDLYF